MQEYSYAQQHMGTQVSLSFVMSDQVAADAVAAEIFTRIAAYESLCSRFIPESELSQLNLKREMIVSPEFMQLVLRAGELYKQTDGIFNPLVQVGRLGYVQSFNTIVSTMDVDETPYNSVWEDLSIDAAQSFIRLAPTQQLDLGGFLKGYVADHLAQYVVETHPDCRGVVVNIGGDLATRGKDVQQNPFVFYLYNPITGHETPVTLSDQSLATSGTYQRVWRTAQGPQHHIVDAQTQQNPKTDYVLASVGHKDGATAEAFTKVYLSCSDKEVARIIGDEPHQWYRVDKEGNETNTFS